MQLARAAFGDDDLACAQHTAAGGEVEMAADAGPVEELGTERRVLG